MNVAFASGSHVDGLPADLETMDVPGPSDRDERGRFKKGNGGGPGNPYARRCAHLRQLLHSSSTDEEIVKIFEVLKQLALAGDVAAIKLYLAYQIGKPTEAPDPDTLDQQELKIVVESHTQGHDEANRIVNGTPADLLVRTSRELVPMLAGKKQQILSELVRQTAEELADQDAPPVDEEDDLAFASPMQTAANGRAWPNEMHESDFPVRLEGEGLGGSGKASPHCRTTDAVPRATLLKPRTQ